MAALATLAGLFCAGRSYKTLQSYSGSWGGNMNGNSHSVRLTRQEDGTALLVYSDADWHNQEPEINEYEVPAELLDRIAAVFRRHAMWSWDGRRFSRIFVADGETESYSFNFGEKRVSFSSQLYPKYYRDRLAQIEELIAQARAEGRLLRHVDASGPDSE